jgi:hypothetical protein
MALLSAQSSVKGGTVLNFVACTAGGDTVRVGDRTYLLFKNGDAASKTITVAVSGTTSYAQNKPANAIAVAAGAQVIIGPIDGEFATPGTNPATAAITYSAVTSCTIAVIA